MSEHYRRGDPEAGCALIGLVLLIAGLACYAGAWLLWGWAGIIGLALVTAAVLGAAGSAVGVTTRHAP